MTNKTFNDIRNTVVVQPIRSVAGVLHDYLGVEQIMADKIAFYGICSAMLLVQKSLMASAGIGA